MDDRFSYLEMMGLVTAQHALSKEGFVTQFALEGEIRFLRVILLVVAVDGHRVRPVLGSWLDIAGDGIQTVRMTAIVSSLLKSNQMLWYGSKEIWYEKVYINTPSFWDSL